MASASYSGKSAQSAIKRLVRELQEYNSDPAPELVSLRPLSDDNLFRWTASMRGPDGTGYEGGIFDLNVDIPEAYPTRPPVVRFVTRICHPNVDFTTGEICLDLLKTDWSAVYQISSTLIAIHQLLSSPNPDSPLNVDIANLLKLDKTDKVDSMGAESLIRYFTFKEAMS